VAEELLVKWPVPTRMNSSRADGDDAKLINKVGPMARGHEKSDENAGPSPRAFVLAVCVLMVALMCGFYFLSFRY